MHQLTRRDFLQDSAFLASLAALTQLTDPAETAEKAASEAKASKKGPASDRLRVAVVGVNGQGMGHVKGYAGRHNCVVTTICDADSAVVRGAMQHVTKVQGKEPRYEQDIRRVVEDKNIDVISIATPNHWHALASIWAMQNGKDVYVEKPVSHNIQEGRRMVETARKYGKICQTGTQSRSSRGMREAVAFLHSGQLGTIRLARGLCYKLRPSIGKVSGPQPVPDTVNYDLWCGPAPKKPLMRKRLHYDWHWVWDTGNGDLGNQGIHEMDKARWGLNKDCFPHSVVSLGGRFGYLDDGETANTQISLFDYGDCQLIFEVRGWPSETPFPGKESPKSSKRPTNFVDNVWYGTKGFLVCPSYSSGIAYNNDGEVIKRFNGGGDHFGNFLQAVRSRKYQVLHADILEGHLSSALCHLGNISYRLGSLIPGKKKVHPFGSMKEGAEAFASMIDHLQKNKVDFYNLEYRLGRKLLLDVTRESFQNDREANQLLTREYRKGFEILPSV